MIQQAGQKEQTRNTVVEMPAFRSKYFSYLKLVCPWLSFEIIVCAALTRFQKRASGTHPFSSPPLKGGEIPLNLVENLTSETDFSKAVL
jgi:hypothetical protein